MGYYRENCPNSCISPPPTPDSMASTPPTTPPPSPPGYGILWGSLGFDPQDEIDAKKTKEKKRCNIHKHADLSRCRLDSVERKEQLKESDFAIGGFEFFARADEGYNKTLPEMTLHQVLRRLMRLVERRLAENVEKLEAKVDVTLLHPPNNPDREHFYTKALDKIKVSIVIDSYVGNVVWYSIPLFSLFPSIFCLALSLSLFPSSPLSPSPLPSSSPL